MIQIGIENNQLRFAIDGVEQKLVFDLNTAIAVEEEFGGYSVFYERLMETRTILSVLTHMINYAIQKYNRQYNQTQPPINPEGIGELLQGSDVLKAKNAVIGLLLGASDVKNVETTPTIGK